MLQDVAPTQMEPRRAGVAEQPKNLDVLAEIKILKTGASSCESPMQQSMLYLPGTVVRGARRVEWPRRKGEEAAQEKRPKWTDGVEFRLTSPLANTRSQCPRRVSSM